MTFIIQTRQVVNVRGINTSNTNSSGQSDWINQNDTYDNLEEAQQQCKKLIDESCHKASNVRIVSVVCTFETDIKTHGVTI